MLYTEKDIENSMDKIETINFHQVSYLIYKWFFLTQFSRNYLNCGNSVEQKNQEKIRNFIIYKSYCYLLIQK